MYISGAEAGFLFVYFDLFNSLLGGKNLSFTSFRVAPLFSRFFFFHTFFCLLKITEVKYELRQWNLSYIGAGE